MDAEGTETWGGSRAEARGRVGRPRVSAALRPRALPSDGPDSPPPAAGRAAGAGGGRPGASRAEGALAGAVHAHFCPELVT